MTNAQTFPAFRGAVAIVLAGLAAGARAEEPAPPAPSPAATLEERLRSLEERVEASDQARRVAERKAELAAEEAAAKAKTKPTIAAAPGKGFTVALPDERFSLNLRLRIQMRDTLLRAGGRTTNEITVRTIRLWATGNVLWPVLRYGIQLAFGSADFEPANGSPIFDGYVELTRLRDLNVRVGQYFVPFDRLRTVRESTLQMVDRPQPIVELTLDRDVGLTLSSQDLFGARGILNYAVGVFGGEGRNRFGGQAMGGLYAARLGVRPMGLFDDDSEGDLERLPRPRLALGAGFAYNQRTTRARSTTGPTLTFDTVDFLHAAADVVFKWRGLYFAGEFVYRKALQDFVEGMVDGKAVREYTRSGYGYVAQVAYMTPRYVEIVARWAQLFSLAGTDPTLVKLVADQGHELGAGLNVYLNGHAFKLQSDFFWLFGDDPSNGRYQWRVQLDASF